MRQWHHLKSTGFLVLSFCGVFNTRFSLHTIMTSQLTDTEHNICQTDLRSAGGSSSVCTFRKPPSTTPKSSR